MEFKPHTHQKLALDSLARFILALAGVQGGKTTLGVIWLLREIYKAYEEGKRGDWLIAAPTVKILQQSTLPKFKQFFPPDWGTWKEQKSCFELAWGDNIYVRSTEEPDYLEGMTIRGAWLDEAGKMKHQAWINIQARLAINRGRAIFTTTPYAVNWVNSDLLKNTSKINGVDQGKGDPDIEVFAWESIENPAFPKEEYERARRTMSTALFERRYKGKFTALEGLVYPDFNEDLIVEPFQIPDHWKKFGGMDFGLTNPTAILCLAEDPETHIFYVYREFYRSDTSLTLIAEFIQSEDLKYVLADPQSAMVISELQKFHGVKEIKPADNEISLGIERIGSLLRSQRLRFFRGRTDKTIEEIEQYHYPPTDGDKPVTDKPVAKNNHAMDALRYAFSKQVESSLYNRNKRTRIPIALAERHHREVDPYTGY